MSKTFLSTIQNPDQTITFVDTAGRNVTTGRSMDVRVITPDAPGSYPVVFYSHGHFANPSGAGSTNARALADMGYIVIVPTHLDSAANPAAIRDAYAFENPASTLHRVADMKFALESLPALMASAPGYVAMTEMPIIAGHSHGARTASLLAGVETSEAAYTDLPPGNPYGLTSLNDARFKASILLSPPGRAPNEDDGAGHDETSWQNNTRPSLMITGTLDTTSAETDYSGRLDGLDLSPGLDKYAVVLTGADHLDIGGFSATAAQTNAIVKLMGSFLDAYVKGRPNALLDPSTILASDALYGEAYVRSAGLSSGSVIGSNGTDKKLGHVTDDRLLVGGGADTVDGGQGADTIAGEDGDDEILGGAGGDGLHGGAGHDTLIGDGPLSLTAAAQQIKRLYIATLDRAPDDAGWQSWTNELVNGRPLTDIAGGFVGSAEFQAKYGTLSNTDFVKTLYRNVLDREADQGGLTAFTDALNSGAQTRTQVVVNFSESGEFINGTTPSLHAGQIYRLYGATLARAPDAGGFEGWTDAMAGGRGLVDIAAGFVGSGEFQTRYGSLDNEGFVTLLYQNVLGRAPDAGGLAGWKQVLDTGAQTRTQVVTGFSESGEYINATRAAMDAFVRNVMSAWSDTLVGGQGDDKLTGGRGSDRFVFTRSEGGNDTIYGFESFDTLELNGFGYANSAAALAVMSQQGANVVLGYTGGSITFEATQLSVLQSMTAQGWVLG